MKELIIIEGTDACGKATQTKCLKDYFHSNNKNVATIDYPAYESEGSIFVRDYLSGKYADTATGVSAKQASLFYALDRYKDLKTGVFKEALKSDIILANRYTTSNAIFQAAKLDSEKEKIDFCSWLFDLEYSILGLPKPTNVILLSLPIEVTQSLLLQRYSGNESCKDLHESDIALLNKARETSLFLANYYNWHVINCYNNSESRVCTIDEVTKKIREVLLV